MSRNIFIAATVWFIIVGGLLFRIGRPPICIRCGNNALDLGIAVITLAVALVTLGAALRLPAADRQAGALR